MCYVEIEIPERDKLERSCRVAALLQSLRLPGHSDVVLHCREQELFAHKLMLESGGQYFKTLLHDKMVESKSNGVIHLDMKEVEPPILGIILNYLYLGSVKDAKTTLQIIDVMIAAHKMKLEELVEFCADLLLQRLCHENVFNILDGYLACKLKEKWFKVMNYIFVNLKELSTTLPFLSVSVDVLRTLSQTAKNEGWCVDHLLAGILRWLQQDAGSRTEFTVELLALMDIEFIRQESVKDVLNIPMSPDLYQKVKKICLTVLLTDMMKYLTSYLGKHKKPFFDTKTLPGAENILVHFSRYLNCDKFDADILGNPHGFSQSNCIQIFNVDTMTWLPARSSSINLEEIIVQPCGQRGKDIMLICGKKEPKCIRYDILQNKFSECYEDASKFKRITYASLCKLNGFIYAIGAKTIDKETTISEVLFKKAENRMEWHNGKPLKLALNCGTVLASLDCMYVVGCAKPKYKEMVIQFNAAPEKGNAWDTFVFPKGSVELNHRSFFVFHNVLCAVYFNNDETVLITFDSKERKVVEKRFAWIPCGEDDNTELFVWPFPSNVSSSYVYVSTWVESSLPDLTFYPESGIWKKLGKEKGIQEVATGDAVCAII